VEFFIDTEMPRTTRVTGITVCLALVACGPRSTTTTRHEPPITVDAGVIAPMIDAGPSVTRLFPSQPKTRLEGPHGGAITDLAVTADGTAAITSDDLGGHRLWPALDGSLEPRVVELPSPSQLAIKREPKGFLIALIDEAGGLVLQQIDLDGLLLQRASLPIEPTYKGVAMTDGGPLAWRSDHRIVRLAEDGTIVAQLAADQGQRILHVAVPAIGKADRAIAVIEGSTETTTWRRARYLSIGDKLAWGAWISAGDAIEPNLAVSPDLKRFAFLTPPAPPTNQPKLTVVDLASSTVIYSETAFNVATLEMPDAGNVVYAANGQTIWLDVQTKKPRIVTINQPSSAGVLTSGGGKSFNANGSELAISTATGSEYLGYALQGAQIAAAGGNGQLAIAWGDRAALLDDKLRAQPLAMVANHSINAMRWLTGTEWLVQTLRMENASTVLAVVDLAGTNRTDVRTNLPAGQLAYEPSSKLVGVSFGAQPEVYRYVPGKKLESIASYPKLPPYDRVLIQPVSPALSGGTQVVVSHAKDVTTVRWVPDARALDKGVSMTVDGAVAAIDVAGKVYAWSNTGKGVLELALLRDGKRIGAMAVERDARSVRPDAKGERVLVTHATGVSLHDADGKMVWTKTLTGISHVVWLDDGAIAVITGLGILRLDAATGAQKTLRCAWLFERSATPHAMRTRGEPMCTQRR